MKKILYLIPLLLCMCTTSKDENNTPASTFSFDLTPSVISAVIGQTFTITVNANETINTMWVSQDNFATGGFASRTFGTSFPLYFNFDTLGVKTIWVRSTNSKNEVSQKQITINIARGNAIKIIGLQVITFDGINTSWDPEFSITDPNRLADLKFGFVKGLLGNPMNNSSSSNLWYVSPTIQNQGNMTWSMANENLFIDPTKTFEFALSDDDGYPVAQNLLPGVFDTKTIGFSNYLVTKPTTITYTFPDVNLEFKLFVEWAN